MRGRGEEGESERERVRGRGEEGEGRRERVRGRGEEGEGERERGRGRGEEGEGRMGEGLVGGRRNYKHTCMERMTSLMIYIHECKFQVFFSPLQQFPYPDTSQDPFLMALSFGLPLLLMFSFIYTAATITKVG